MLMLDESYVSEKCWHISGNHSPGRVDFRLSISTLECTPSGNFARTVQNGFRENSGVYEDGGIMFLKLDVALEVMEVCDNSGFYRSGM